MKSRKAKTKRNAKRNPKQHPTPAAEQVQFVPAPGMSAELTSIVETPSEIEHSAPALELHDEIVDSASAAQVQGETEESPKIKEMQAEMESSVVPVQFRDEAGDFESTVAVPSETEQSARANEAPSEVENAATPGEHRDINEDAASTVELRDQPHPSEDLESIFELHVEVESAASPADPLNVPGDVPGNAANATGHRTSRPEIYDGKEIPVIPVDTPPVAQMPTTRSAPRTAADRRAHPRYAFAAAIEVVAPELGERIKSQVRDLSQQGCYVDTDRPLDLGTATEVRILKGSTRFEARARVVYIQAAKGMGLMFTTVELEQLKTLDTWITESRESSWRAANRRRSQRVMMKVPVRVSGQAADGANFEVETHTLSISPHGALLVLAPAVQRGQRFILANLQTKAALECVVAHLERIAGEPTQVGVEFSLPNPAFWRVAFPPKDWTPRHPDAKSR